MLATQFTCDMAKGQGVLSGDLMMNMNFFNRDTAIGANNNPLYDNLLSGGEGWLGLRYSNNGFTGIVRFDGFQNSNLLNPTSAFSGSGIGMFSLEKEWNKLTLKAGHIYDQIGSGIIFRGYEDRGLLIDQAVFGFQAKYRFKDNLVGNVFTGQIKNLFERYNPIIKGASIQADYGLGDKAYLTTGIGAVNRTMDQGSMDGVVAVVNSLDSQDRFIPKYNSYAATLYNTLNVGDFTWYAEGALKSEEAISTIDGLISAPGSVLYSNMGYAKSKWGLNASVKRTENFVMRTSPNEVLIRGLYNWQPIIAQIRTQRVIARYTPQSQDVSEQSFNVSGIYTPNKKISSNLSYTYADDLEGEKLYREIYGELEIRPNKKWIIHLGAQYMEYNQELYQIKSGAPLVVAMTPFAEFVYKIDKKRSIRTELQWMNTEQDYGAWAFALVEFNIAPKWSLALTDMYNYAPSGVNGDGLDPQHYPNVFVAHTKGPHRFTAQYVKQVEGINCTGGVCRYEPAFSGFKFGISSTF